MLRSIRRCANQLIANRDRPHIRRNRTSLYLSAHKSSHRAVVIMTAATSPSSPPLPSPPPHLTERPDARKPHTFDDFINNPFAIVLLATTPLRRLWPTSKFVTPERASAAAKYRELLARAVFVLLNFGSCTRHELAVTSSPRGRPSCKYAQHFGRSRAHKRCCVSVNAVFHVHVFAHSRHQLQRSTCACKTHDGAYIMQIASRRLINSRMPMILCQNNSMFHAKWHVRQREHDRNLWLCVCVLCVGRPRPALRFHRTALVERWEQPPRCFGVLCSLLGVFVYVLCVYYVGGLCLMCVYALAEA